MIAPTGHPFLIGLLRDENSAALPRLAAEERHWDVIVRDAIGHGLGPLLYRWLRCREVRAACPARLFEKLEGHALGVAARNIVWAKSLANTLGILEASGVVCAPLRGLALAERLYGDITVRPMGDADLLVRQEDLFAVSRVLRGSGFKEIDRRAGFARAYSYTLEFAKDRHGWIEPHWTIAYPPFVDRIDMDAVWARCVRGTVVGIESWSLGREDLLLHLCFHLIHRNGSAPLLWFSEVDRLIRREPMDWSRVLSTVREAELEFLLSQVFRQVTALFDSPIPAEIRGQLTREPPRSIEGRLLRFLAGTSRVDGKESLAVLFALKGFRSKLRYAFEVLFPCPAFMVARHGRRRRIEVGVAYGRRLSRFAWEALKGVASVAF